MEADNINIEEIMSEIKREIKEKNLSNDILSFEDVPYRKPSQSGGSVQEAMDALSSGYYIQPYKELKGNPVKVFIKKVIRKMTKFYVEPVVFEQDEFNANTVAVLRSLTENGAADNSEKIAALELSQKELIKRLNKLELENEKLRAQLEGKDEA